MRATLADRPENSDYTSIQERITPTFNLADAIKAQTEQGKLLAFNVELKPLLHFDIPTVTFSATNRWSLLTL